MNSKIFIWSLRASFLLFLPFLSLHLHAYDDPNAVYSAPIVRRLGIRQPQPHTLDRETQQHHRQFASFVNAQFRIHRQLTDSLNRFFLSHPNYSLDSASLCVSNLNALIESKAWVKLAKSNRTFLNPADRKRFRERVERDVAYCMSLVSSLTERGSSSASFDDPIAIQPDPIPVVSVSLQRPKKKNWSFLEQRIGQDLELDTLRRNEYERQLALRGVNNAQRANATRRFDAQLQLQDAQRQLWQAEQERIRAEQAARENRDPFRQGSLDSQAEISRQQQMWAEQRKRDAELHLLHTP